MISFGTAFLSCQRVYRDRKKKSRYNLFMVIKKKIGRNLYVAFKLGILFDICAFSFS